MSMTFDDYSSKLMREAAKIVAPNYLSPARENSENKAFRRVLDMALLAYCRGVIKSGPGECCGLFVAELRQETKAETALRIAGMLPNQVNNHAALAALAAKNENLAKRVRGLDMDELAAMKKEDELILAVARGHTEKIPANAKPVSAEFASRLLGMSNRHRTDYTAQLQRDFADLVEYIENVANPSKLESVPALTDAELRWCNAEGVAPADFLQKKLDKLGK